MNSLFGMNVRTSSLVRPVPVLQLRSDFTACTEEFRESMNAWLLEKFGTKEVAYVVNGRDLVLNAETLQALKRKLLNTHGKYLHNDNFGIYQTRFDRG